MKDELPHSKSFDSQSLNDPSALAAFIPAAELTGNSAHRLKITKRPCEVCKVFFENSNSEQEKELF